MAELLAQLNLKNWIRHKSAHNFIFLSFIQISNIVISLLSIRIITSAIKLDQFGLVSLALSIIMVLNVVVNYGYHLSGPREVALNSDNKEKLSEILSKVLVSKLFIATILFLGLSVCIFFIGVFERYALILFMSGIILFSESLFSAWFAQGLERMKIVSIGNLISKLIYLFLLIGFIKTPEDSKWVNFFWGASALLTNLVLVAFMTGQWNLRIKIVSLSDILLSIKTNFLLFLSALISHVSISSGVIILSFFADNFQLGLYSLAERIMFVLRMFPVLVIQSVYPHASKLYRDNREHFFSFVNKVLIISVSGSFFLALSSFFLAPWIIYFLSNDFHQGSINIFRILCFIPFISSLNIGNMLLVLASGNNKLLFKGTLLSAVFMLIGCITLTSYAGSAGLALALLVTEIFIFSIQLYLNVRHIKYDTKQLYNYAFGSYYHR